MNLGLLSTLVSNSHWTRLRYQPPLVAFSAVMSGAQHFTVVRATLTAFGPRRHMVGFHLPQLVERDCRLAVPCTPEDFRRFMGKWGAWDVRYRRLADSWSRQALFTRSTPFIVASGHLLSLFEPTTGLAHHDEAHNSKGFMNFTEVAGIERCRNPVITRMRIL